jgi:hypothetical protein
MKLSSYVRGAVGIIILIAFSLAARGAKPTADIPPPDTRKSAVETAERLARTSVSAPLPKTMPGPFNPPGFDKADHPEANTTGAAAPNSATAATAPATDREALAAVAAKIPTTGTINLGGKPLLISGVNKIEIGSHFTVVYNGQEYELELVAITSTTFTVRYKGEEYTRPIRLQVPTKQGK